MSKVLCIISLVISAVVFLLFVLDLIVPSLAFGGAGGLWGNLGMICGSLMVAVFSVLTLPECR